jgi:hypothetical protein
MQKLQSGKRKSAIGGCATLSKWIVPLEYIVAKYVSTRHVDSYMKCGCITKYRSWNNNKIYRDATPPPPHPGRKSGRERYFHDAR